MESNVNQGITSLSAILDTTARLKEELRHGWSSDGARRESVAEHCFQLGLFALLVAPILEHKVDSERLIKMCLVHDLAEAITGDTPYISEASRLSKKQDEETAMQALTGSLPESMRSEIVELWSEFEGGVSTVAKCARALDGLEAQMQHNIAPIKTWEPREYGFVYTKMDRWCDYDGTLKALCDRIKIGAVSGTPGPGDGRAWSEIEAPCDPV